MTEISVQEILKAIDKIKFADYQLVVGIAEGGVVPAAFVAHKIGCPLEIVRLNYRNKENIPQHPEPLLLNKVGLPENINRILLVDDVSISGKTMNAAKKIFKDYQVATLVLRGRADYVVFPQLNTCVNWPWNE